MAQTFPTFTVKAGFSSATSSYGVWDDVALGLWDTALWGPDVVWSDITKYVLGFHTQIGRQKETDHFATGIGSVALDNTDGRFSPENLNGPYVTGGVSGIRPWRPVSITTTIGGVVYPLFYGLALTFDDTFETSNRTITQLPLVDMLSVIAGHNGLPGGQASIGAYETSGKRIQRLLNDAGFTLPRNIAIGNNTVQATTMSANSLTEIQQTADSEGGAFWCDPDGSAQFESGTSLLENARSVTSQATFSDNPSPATNIPYDSAIIKQDGLILWNIINGQRVGGLVQTVSDGTSRSLYGDRAQNLTNLICETDTQVAALIKFYLTRFKDPERRVLEATFNVAVMGATNQAAVAGRRMRDRCTFVRSPVTTGTAFTISRQVFVDGIDHTVDAQNQTWMTTLKFQSAAAWDSAGPGTGLWDTTIIGGGATVWDTAKWF